MPEKLDPRLLDAVERAAAGGVDDAGDTEVDVIVGLDGPLDAGTRQDLTARGLRVRSEIGDVLTGSMLLRAAHNVAASPHVRAIEASGPLFPESSAEDTTFDEGGGG